MSPDNGTCREMTTLTEKRARKDQRLNVRVDAQTRELLVRAAEVAGVGLSDFLLSVARERAERLVQQPVSTRVSPEEFCRILDLIENPPAPTDYLVEAMAE